MQNLRGLEMTQRDLAGRLDINVKTLRKWKKDRPKVYELLMIGLKAESMISNFKENCQELEKLIQSQDSTESEEPKNP
ncbi:hypothetical protein [Helicobacter sp. MIT 05-5294]|uniref:hypothetical protein n=1 Tax=Helicobacter sp. MIT 05-5294 TaxID=1548150 RepID=UPI0010FF55EF|nr:hypothetical protein [Helicobacter sp. MIT 05-5294]TLD85945.1 hypothetical protein LS69_007190 [Helicobacter sp. MIT 05-5294]